MAIIVENMNMPSTCTMCWISNICQEHIHDLNHIGYEKRLDDCPLRDVVRCKDCVYWEQATDNSGNCNRAFEITAYWGDYCSYGERREDGRNAISIQKG